jgi:hypothetical protein
MLTARQTSALAFDYATTGVDRARIISYGANTSTAGVIAFSTESSDGSVGGEVMRLDSSGNLGLGVTPSAWRNVYKAFQTNGGSFYGFTSNDRIGVVQNGYVDSTSTAWTYVATAASSRYDQIGGVHAWYNAPSGTAGSTISFTTAMEVDASSNLKFNSGYGSAATAYGCRAWVNFNGTGTVAIRGSGNVSSITDNGTGDYTVNFTTAMPDVDYCAVGTVGNDVTSVIGVRVTFFNSYAVGSVRMRTVNNNSDDAQDVAIANVSVFR